MKIYEVIDQEFQRAVAELSAAPIDVAVGYRLTEVLEKVAGEIGKYRALHQKLLDKHVKKNKAGQPQTTKDKAQYVMKDRAAFDEEYKTLISIEVEIPKIKINDIKDLKLSTLSISKLKPLIIP